MNATPSVERPGNRVDNRASGQGQHQTTPPKPWRKFLLAYWAFAIPRDARIVRVAFLQPFTGIIAVLAGIVMSVWGWMSHAVAFGVGGVVLAVLGAVMASTAYWFSVLYFQEYPGGFSADLEEYVARRVSRLSRDEFIPRYKAQSHADALKIRILNHQVALALKAETLRLRQSERTSPMPIYGVLVVGPQQSNKTWALWDAMMQQLGGWTFVRWPHHMDCPDKLISRLGQRIVLWLDDLHDFANLGEAAALDQFVQLLREDGREFLVLSSCRDGQSLQEAKRYFRPLMGDLREVRARDSLPPTTQLKTLRTAYSNLSENQQSVLEAVDWLESLRIHTFPWEVVQVVSNEFSAPGPGQESDVTTIEGLANHPDKFVQVNQRADPRSARPSDRYDFRDWFLYTFFRRRSIRMRGNNASHPVHFVVKPTNVSHLGLGGSRKMYSQKMAVMFEQNPEHIVRRLEGFPFAAETLILLGDAYLNHLGEHIDNAPGLAIRCYDGALQMLNMPENRNQYPGAWAAAHVGKGTAKLRMRKPREVAGDVANDFKMVTNPEIPAPGGRPTPRLLTAYAWHGQGDAIAAQISSDAAAQVVSGGSPVQLQDAASYYELAGSSLPSGDPLKAETRLDRANVLYAIARVATNMFAESLFALPSEPPTAAVDAAQTAYREVLESYAKVGSPAVWAEVQRRLGELCLMRLTWLLSTNMRSPRHPSDAGAAKIASFAGDLTALEQAKIARDYFAAACDVFAPSYLPMSWLDAQVGLVRAHLVIARSIALQEPDKARSLYLLCLDIIDRAMQQIAMPGQSPLDWVDLQLLRAQSEFGIGALGEGDAKAHYQFASKTLANVTAFLDLYGRLHDDAKSKRTVLQVADAESLSADIKRVAPHL